MKLREERLAEITQRLMKEKQVISRQLAEDFGLSVAAIRLDLTELESRGMVRRVHGGAILAETSQVRDRLRADEMQFGERFSVQLAQKRAIGRAVANLVRDGETIMIDHGTTTHQVCVNLRGKKDLTIITSALNSFWQELASTSDVSIFFTGGFLRAKTLSMVGELAENMVRNFRASKAIVGIDGISIEHGLTTLSFLEAGVKRRMIENSQELIVVADHTKFGQVAPLPVGPVESASKVITDDGISPRFVAALEDRGVQVIIAQIE